MLEYMILLKTMKVLSYEDKRTTDYFCVVMKLTFVEEFDFYMLKLHGYWKIYVKGFLP